MARHRTAPGLPSVRLPRTAAGNRGTDLVGEATRSGPNPTAVPVLLYHAVTTTPSPTIAPFTVTPDDFRRQLDAVLESGRRVVPLAEHLLELSGSAADDGGAPRAVVTFDDGYADILDHALPAMVERGVPATVYVTTRWLHDVVRPSPGPGDRMLSSSMLSELLDAGLTIGAHSRSHPHLDVLPTAQLRDEVRGSRDDLEQVLQRPVTDFAFPHGYSGPRVRRAAVEAGYRSAASVRDALSHRGDDAFGIARLMLRSDTSAQAFAGWLDGSGAATAVPREALRTRAWRGYRRSRAILVPSRRTEYR